MPSHSSFIYKIICIGVMFLCLLSCAPKPELEWVPEIRAVSAKVTDNTCVLTAETSADLAGGGDCGFLYGKTKDDMQRVKAVADGKKFNIILESLDYDTDYVYRAYVGNGRNEICSDISYFRILKEKEISRSMTLPFDKIELESRESEFLVEVGGDADFTVNIPDTVSWIFYRRDNRNCRFQVKANTETDDRRCDVVFTNLSDNQSDTLSVVQAAKVNYGDDYIDEYGVNHGPGVKIGETVWAPVNCGYHATDFKYGKLYQWGRKYGQGYEGGLMDGDDYNAGEFSDVSVPEIEAGPVDLATGQSKENKFYYGSDNSYYWCTDQKSNFWNSGTEENPVKTEYDPCPDGWRVPAYAELEQLSFNYSSWITDENSQPGYWFSGPGIYAGTTPQVFFPAAGLRAENGMCTARGGFGFYWSSRPIGHDAISILCFCNTEVGVDVGNPRATGCSVRCVQDDSALIPVANITLSKTSMSLSVGNSETITYSIAPSNANHQSAHWWSDNPEIASVDQNGNVAGVSGGATIIYAMAGMQVETCSVTVTGASNPRDYIDEYGINHGPGVKIGETVWAPVNCGYHATDFKYGKLYQWGRKYGQGYSGGLFDDSGEPIGYYSDATVPQINKQGGVSLIDGQSESNSNVFFLGDEITGYWVNLPDDTLWNSGTESDPVKTVYDPCPEGWRVPTYAELNELRTNRSSWITDPDAYYGYWFSGASIYKAEVPQIFFSAAGARSSDVDYAGDRASHGFYWSSRPYDAKAYSLVLCCDYTYMSYYDRALGASVRCVKE